MSKQSILNLATRQLEKFRNLILRAIITVLNKIHSILSMGLVAAIEIWLTLISSSAITPCLCINFNKLCNLISNIQWWLMQQMYIVRTQTETCCFNKIVCIATAHNVTYQHYILFIISLICGVWFKNFCVHSKLLFFCYVHPLWKQIHLVLSILIRVKEQIWECKCMDIFVFANCALHIISHCYKYVYHLFMHT